MRNRHRRREQGLESEGRVKPGVPGGDAAGEHAAHGQGSAEPLRVALDETGGDNAAE